MKKLQIINEFISYAVGGEDLLITYNDITIYLKNGKQYYYDDFVIAHIINYIWTLESKVLDFTKI